MITKAHLNLSHSVFLFVHPHLCLLLLHSNSHPPLPHPFYLPSINITHLSSLRVTTTVGLILSSWTQTAFYFAAFHLVRSQCSRQVEADLYLKIVKMFGWLNPFKLNGWHPREAYQKWLKRVEDSVCVKCQDESAQAGRPAPRARKLISISAHSNLPSPEQWS